MNKLSVALNIILVAAVGFLYYNNFSAKKGGEAATTQLLKDSCTNPHRIAYVELDSLNENLLYFKQRRKDLEVEQKKVEDKITSDYKSLDEKKNGFLQKNPNARPEELQNFQGQLIQEQQSIETERQRQSQYFSQKNYELMENIQKNLKEFLAEYNKTKKFQYILTTGAGLDYLIFKDSTLDITRDVIKGLNERMKPVSK